MYSHAGMKILESLTRRAGAGRSEEQQLILEALLPHKEVIVKQLNASLKDSEPKVTALANAVMQHMERWP